MAHEGSDRMHEQSMSARSVLNVTQDQQPIYSYGQICKLGVTYSVNFNLAVQDLELQLGESRSWRKINFFSRRLNQEWLNLEDLVTRHLPLVQPEDKQELPDFLKKYEGARKDYIRLANDCDQIESEYREQRRLQEIEAKEKARDADLAKELSKLIHTPRRTGPGQPSSFSDMPSTSAAASAAASASNTQQSSSVKEKESEPSKKPPQASKIDDVTILKEKDTEEIARQNEEQRLIDDYYPSESASDVGGATSAAANEQIGRLLTANNDLQNRLRNLEMRLSQTASQQQSAHVVGRSDPPLETSALRPNFAKDYRLPNFDGSREDWPNFRECIERHVVHAPNLTDLDRIMVVKGLISGTAARVTKAFVATSENWIPFWETLKDRFDADLKDSNNDVATLLDMPCVKSKWSREEFQCWLDSFNSQKRVLGLSGISFDNSVFGVEILLRKLDANLQKDLKLQFEEISVEKIIAFLEARMRAAPAYKGDGQSPNPTTLAGFATAAADKKKQKKDEKKKSKKSDGDKKPTGGKDSSSATTSDGNDKKKKKEKKKPDPNEVCWLCKTKGQHFFWKCPSLKNLTPKERIQLALAENRCHLCCNATHQGLCEKTFPCRSKCSSPGSHHFLLHDPEEHS